MGVSKLPDFRWEMEGEFSPAIPIPLVWDWLAPVGVWFQRLVGLTPERVWSVSNANKSDTPSLLVTPAHLASSIHSMHSIFGQFPTQQHAIDGPSTLTWDPGAKTSMYSYRGN